MTPVRQLHFNIQNCILGFILVKDVTVIIRLGVFESSADIPRLALVKDDTIEQPHSKLCGLLGCPWHFCGAG